MEVYLDGLDALTTADWQKSGQRAELLKQWTAKGRDPELFCLRHDVRPEVVVALREIVRAVGLDCRVVLLTSDDRVVRAAQHAGVPLTDHRCSLTLSVADMLSDMVLRNPVEIPRVLITRSFETVQAVAEITAPPGGEWRPLPYIRIAVSSAAASASGGIDTQGTIEHLLSAASEAPPPELSSALDRWCEQRAVRVSGCSELRRAFRALLTGQPYSVEPYSVVARDTSLGFTVTIRRPCDAPLPSTLVEIRPPSSAGYGWGVLVKNAESVSTGWSLRTALLHARRWRVSDGSDAAALLDHLIASLEAL